MRQVLICDVPETGSVLTDLGPNLVAVEGFNKGTNFHPPYFK